MTLALSTLLRIALAVWGSLVLPWEVLNCLFCVCEDIIEVLMGIILNLWITLITRLLTL